MHAGFFKGRASMRGQDDENNKKKAKTSIAERKRRKIKKAEKRKKSSHLSVNYPIPPGASMVKKRYRHACNNCPGTFVADSQEAFCRYCRGNALTITDVLENS
mgnify:FL=1